MKRRYIRVWLSKATTIEAYKGSPAESAPSSSLAGPSTQYHNAPSTFSGPSNIIAKALQANGIGDKFLNESTNENAAIVDENVVDNNTIIELFTPEVNREFQEPVSADNNTENLDINDQVNPSGLVRETIETTSSEGSFFIGWTESEGNQRNQPS